MISLAMQIATGKELVKDKGFKVYRAKITELKKFQCIHYKICTLPQKHLLKWYFRVTFGNDAEFYPSKNRHDILHLPIFTEQSGLIKQNSYLHKRKRPQFPASERIAEVAFLYETADDAEAVRVPLDDLGHDAKVGGGDGLRGRGRFSAGGQVGRGQGRIGSILKAETTERHNSIFFLRPLWRNLLF